MVLSLLLDWANIVLSLPPDQTNIVPSYLTSNWVNKVLNLLPNWVNMVLNLLPDQAITVPGHFIPDWANIVLNLSRNWANIVPGHLIPDQADIVLNFLISIQDSIHVHQLSSTLCIYSSQFFVKQIKH